MQVGTNSTKLGLAAQAAGSYARARRQSGKGFVVDRDESITGVSTRRNSSDRKGLVERSRQVFEAVHGQVDPARVKGLFNFFGEHPLRHAGSHLGKRQVLHGIARREDDFDGHFMAALAQAASNVIGLPEGELRAAGTDLQM